MLDYTEEATSYKNTLQLIANEVLTFEFNSSSVVSYGSELAMLRILKFFRWNSHYSMGFSKSLEKHFITFNYLGVGK
jgi:hypothetical protein